MIQLTALDLYRRCLGEEAICAQIFRPTEGQTEGRRTLHDGI